MGEKELRALLAEARSYVSVAAMEGHKPAADLVDRMTEALAQPAAASPHNVGRFCMSEDECQMAGVDFASYERGVIDAAKAFEGGA